MTPTSQATSSRSSVNSPNFFKFSPDYHDNDDANV